MRFSAQPSPTQPLITRTPQQNQNYGSHSLHHRLVARVSTCANCSSVTVYVLSPPLASEIMSLSSSSVMVSPSSRAIFLRLSKLMVFLSSKANNWKALSISSSDYFSFILAVMICRNSVQSIELELSFSFCSLFISEINFFISSFFGSKPKALSATLSYLISITPEPSASNRSKASLMSFFCFSVSSCRKVSFDFIFFAVFFSFSLFITVIYQCNCRLHTRLTSKSTTQSESLSQQGFNAISSFFQKRLIIVMPGNKWKKDPQNLKQQANKPTINVTKLVKEVCSVYIEKGRYHSTASKLATTKGKCIRMSRELQILATRFKLL